MTWLFSGAILLSSCMLFLVQPLCAKMLLPYLGGTPAVWNTCMVFFQAGLLLGYAYAHYVPRWLGTAPHALLHVSALLLTYFLLPIRFPTEMLPGWPPVIWLLTVLTLQAGLAFVLLSASGPLLQRWFVCKTLAQPRDPYFLYAASNLGSFLALGIFPFLLEPNLPLTGISELWTFGYLALTCVIAFCVPLHAPSLATPAVTSSPLNRWMRGRWILLAMIPSSLLLSVTTSITTDIAPIPLLWLIPMGIYLLTFTLVFASKPPVAREILVRWLPLMVLVLTIVMLAEAAEPMLLVVGLHLLGLFWLAMLCHGELARTRPAAAYLTDFYLCLAVGGVLGGIFTALIAPLVFSGQVEYPLMIVLACFFGMDKASRPAQTDVLWAGRLGVATAFLVLALQSEWFVKLPPGPGSVAVMFGVPLMLCYTTQARPARFTLSLAAILLSSGLYHGIHGASIYRERSYFGIHRVTEVNRLRQLIHGNILHGQQNPAQPRQPLTYYSKAGPIGDVFRSFNGDPRLQNVGVVGLGAGSLAAYSEAGQQWTFFEIDPTVERIASNPNFFTYLADARGKVRIELGDARLQLQQSPAEFGLLVIDAFSSDAIPPHLLTKEALQVYLDHLQLRGILAFHISNNYVDLEPVLAALAQAQRPPLACFIREDRDLSDEAKAQGISPSVWVVLARKTEDLQPLLRSTSWRTARRRPQVQAWTDDFSNLLQVFHWGKSE